MRRLWLVVVGALVFGATMAGVAQARLDRSFGHNGILRYRHPRFEYTRASPTQMAVGPDGKIYLLEDASRCDATTCSTDVYLSRLLHNGFPDSTYNGGEGVFVFHAPEGFPYWSAQVAIDSKGRAVVGLREEEALSIVRLRPDGSPDSSFGGNGRVSLPCGDCEDTALNLRPMGNGGILLWGRHLGSGPSYTSEETLLVARLAPDGELERSFGRGGWAERTVQEANGPGALAVGRGGTITLGGGYACCGSREGIYLTRFRADGSLDQAFARRAARSLLSLNLPLDRRPDAVSAIVPRQHGALDLFGNTEEGGYVMRFKRDGRLDRRFGRNGIKRLKWFLRATAPAGRGRLWVAGGDYRTQGILVFRLGRNGQVIHPRHEAPAVNLQNWAPFEVAIERDRDNVVLFTTGYDLGCRQYCPPSPLLARVLAPRARRHSHR